MNNYCDSYAADCSECEEPVCRRYKPTRNDYDEPHFASFDRYDYGEDYGFKNYDGGYD